MYLYSYKELQTMEKKELLDYIQKLHKEYDKLENMYNELEDQYDQLNEENLELYNMIG